MEPDERPPFDDPRQEFLQRKVKTAAAFHDFVVSFASGYALHYDAAADAMLVAFEWYRPMNSVGMAHTALLELETAGGTGGGTGGGSAGRIYGLGNHSQVDRKRPVILDSREPLFIRAFHDQQDSPPRGRIEGEPADPDARRALPAGGGAPCRRWNSRGSSTGPTRRRGRRQSTRARVGALSWADREAVAAGRVRSVWTHRLERLSGDA